MKIQHLAIPGALLVEPIVFEDPRGYFMESYQKERYAALGVTTDFVQDNLSRSTRGVLRGMHMQNPFAQSKLVSVVEGAVLDVIVDARVGSPKFGTWVGAELSAQNHHQLFVPRGCAHGFCVLTEYATFSYKCDDLYHPETELGIRFDDPDIGIQWPSLELTTSNKDRAYPRLRDIPEHKLLRFES